jgi:hypothetical protein
VYDFSFTCYTRHYISLRYRVNAQCSILALRRCHNKLLCVTLTWIFDIEVRKRQHARHATRQHQRVEAMPSTKVHFESYSNPCLGLKINASRNYERITIIQINTLLLRGKVFILYAHEGLEVGRRRSIVTLSVNLGTMWRSVFYFMPRLQQSRERNPVVFVKKAGWAPEPSWRFRRKSSCLYREPNFRLSGP